MTQNIDQSTRTSEPARKPLRLWPGVVAAVLLVLVRFAVPIVASESMAFAMIGAVAAALAIVVWWVFFSRAPWSERLGVIGLMIAALFVTSRIVHPSIAGGAMGALLYVWAIPLLSLSLVASAALSRRLSSGARRASMGATILLACGVCALIRTDGTTSDLIGSDFHWRWTPTAEERLLAQPRVEPLAPASVPAAPAPSEVSIPAAGDKPPDSARTAPAVLPSAPAVAKTPEARSAAKAVETPATLPSTTPAVKTTVKWPGFRGSDRDGIVRGVRLATDWSSAPPVQLWRRPIGPGWSSFAVGGDLLYTQEQRGEHEVVACYNATNGEPVWIHRDAVRFYESNGGAGPRGTPALSGGRVYTVGATAIVNALDARTGVVVWSRNASSDTGATLPIWAFTSSPLVVDDLVIVAASGRLVAYDPATGRPRWKGPTGHGGSYSSPQLLTIDGVRQILLLSGAGATSVAVADGTELWEHAWPGTAIVQPALIADGDVLITTADAMGGLGTRRLAVTHGPAGWKVEERWTSRGLKPYFNDFVVHKGHAFGFDGTILASIDLEDGQRKWKGGRYGNGQLVLLPDQDLLLVLSEDGDLALVAATPDKFTELARFKAIEGKTWNHPVLVGDVLLVRNGEEMAAFRLTLAGH
jgi:outer membrane protein assembly factor BamB